MAASPGWKALVQIGSTPVTMIQVKSADITANGAIYDVTVMGTNWKSIIPGINDYKLKIMGFFDFANDADQLTLFNAWGNGTLVTWKISPLNDSHNFSGTGYIASIPLKFAVGAPDDAEFDLDSNGALVYV